MAELPVTKTTNVFADHYQVGAILGQGSYSVVRKATRLIDKKIVAVKVVTRSKLQKDDEESLRREVEILMSMDHPNIVKVLDFFQEDLYYYIVLEFMSGGELFDRLMEKAVYTEGEARDLAVVLLKAIKYCHDRDIVHRCSIVDCFLSVVPFAHTLFFSFWRRDIKPENILLVSRDNDINLKLADFGFAVQSAGPPSIKEQVGTPGYIAPEVIEGKPHGEYLSLRVAASRRSLCSVCICRQARGHVEFRRSSVHATGRLPTILRARG